jgi:hypothetical protein
VVLLTAGRHRHLAPASYAAANGLEVVILADRTYIVATFLNVESRGADTRCGPAFPFPARSPRWYDRGSRKARPVMEAQAGAGEPVPNTGRSREDKP